MVVCCPRPGLGTTPARGVTLTTAPAKVCIKCGRDCAGRPRVRDPQGRYTCRECIDNPMPRSSPPLPPSSDEVDLGYALVEEQRAATPTVPENATCMGCGILMAPGALMCTHCGFDTRTGMQAATDQGGNLSGRRCEKCGYDLSGLTKPRCPECGTVFRLRGSLKQRSMEDSREVAKWAYLKPLIMFAIGAVIMLAEQGAQGGLEGALHWVIRYAVEVPIGVAAFWLCCLTFLGFDAPMHLTAIRLAGIYAVTDVVALVAGFIPIPIVPMVIVLTVYIGLLMDTLDLDYQDALLLGLVSGAAKVLIGGAIFFYLILPKM